MSKKCPVCENKYNLFDSLTNPFMCKICFSSERQKAIFSKNQLKTESTQNIVDKQITLKEKLKKYQKLHNFNRWFNLFTGLILVAIVFLHEFWDVADTLIHSFSFTHMVFTILGVSLLSNAFFNWKTTAELKLAKEAISEIRSN